MASSSTKHDVERLVGHCVTHLQDHASHYLSLIQSKRVEGVLWAVFRVGERLLPQGAQQGVELHKASFLALSSMVSSKADVLLRMQRDCDQERQFVCWFTLDDAKGSAVASKVLTIDAGAPVAESRHDDDDAVGQDAPTQHPHGSSVLSNFRNRHERQPEQRSTSREHDYHRQSAAASLVSAVYATPSVAPTMQPLRGTRQEEHTEPGRPRSPRTVRDLLAAVAKTSAPPSKPVEPIRPTTEVSNSGAAEANVTMLMRMVMQVADSVASMGAAMDQLTLRCSSIESEIKQVKDRVHLIEVPMFGDDYDFNASSSPSTSRVGHAGVDGQGQKPHVAWQSNDATMNSSHNSKQKRALLSASEMLIQLTELSLRVGETENRVRVLESSKEAAELQRKILHEQVDALKIRMSDFVKSSQRLQESNSMLGNRDQQSSRHYNPPPPAASDAPSLSNEYPWRQHQQHQQDGDVNRQWSTSATATSSSIAAATRMMDSPFRGYTPPLSSHPSSHNARRLPLDDSPPREHQPTPAQMVATRTSEKEYHYEASSLHASSQVDKANHANHEQQQHQQRMMGQPQGALTDMIRSLETKLGGIRSAR